MWTWRLSAVSNAVLGLAVCIAVAGCEGSARPPGAKPTKPVTVTVTYKGAPVEGATVSFIHESDPAYGRTDAQGVAKMKTYVEGDGAVIGTHKVTINKAETTGAPAADVATEAYDPNAPAPEVKNLIPIKYSSPATSGLTADVKDSGANEFKFELTD
jgi:hypothetical protein